MSPSQPKPQQPAQPTLANHPALEVPPQDLASLPAEQALELFVSDPFTFIRQIVEDAAKTHLSDLKEETELKSTLNTFRKKSPEFQRFEPFILQEVVALLRNDPDGATESWEVLLEKAIAIFGQKFQDTLQTHPQEQSSDENGRPQKTGHPLMETATAKALATEPPSFTRKQLEKMSMAEFLKKEAAINEAIQNNRIR